jgi:DNA-binding NarL/FixJ family response regulator
VLQTFRYTRKAKGVIVNVSIIAGDEKRRGSWEVSLSRTPEFHLDQRFTQAGAAILNLPAADSDVVLLDCDLPDMTGIECLRKLMAVAHGYRVIMLVSPPDPSDLVLLQAIRCGASGVLTKPVPTHELVAAVQIACGSGLVLSSCAMQRLMRLLTQAHSDSPSHPQ